MRGLLTLALLYARRTPIQTAVVSLSIAVALALPLAGRVLVERYEVRLEARSGTVPLVVGAPGSRFDLVLAALFYRSSPASMIPLAVADDLAAQDRGIIVPVHAVFQADGSPIVAIGFDYFELAGLSPAVGDLPGRLGDAVLGAAVAERLGLVPGDSIRSDRRELFDLSAPPPIDLRVVGVLNGTNTVDDDAVFVDIETAWVLEGLSHGHAEASELSSDDVVYDADGAVALRPTMETVTDLTDDTAFGFHLHADRSALPLTGIMVFPSSDKDRTILETGINTAGAYQAVRPVLLVEELFEIVFRIRPVFDAIAALLGAATLALVTLTTVLAARLRAAEFDVLDRVGAPRGFVAGLLAAQTLLVLSLGVSIAVITVGVAVVLSDAWLGL